MIRLYVRNAVLIVAAAAAAYGLAAEYGPLPTLLAWAAGAALACGAGAALLRTSAVGRVTWRNRLAGYLVPWGWRLGRGRLWLVAVASWAVWAGIGIAAVLLRPEAAEELPAVSVRVALFAAWAADAAALVYLLGSIAQASPGGRVGPAWKLVAAIAGVIVASVALHLAGWTTAALVVGGAPPLAAGLGVLVVVLFLTTVGRNTRWN